MVIRYGIESLTSPSNDRCHHHPFQTERYMYMYTFIMSKLPVFALFVTYASAVWPIPSTYTTGNETLWIDRDNVHISYTIANQASECPFPKPR